MADKMCTKYLSLIVVGNHFFKNLSFWFPKLFLLERDEPGAKSCPDAKSQDCPVFHIGSAAGPSKYSRG